MKNLHKEIKNNALDLYKQKAIGDLSEEYKE